MPLLLNKMTTRELALEIKRAPETLIRWRRERVGPPYLRMGGRVLYDTQEVEAWLQSHRNETSRAKKGLAA